MTNNDILRNLRYTFNLSDTRMIEIFALADFKTDRTQISNWLKSDEDVDYKSINDQTFATFLNGFINKRRGKKDGPLPVAEKNLNNNIIFRKLKIALDLKSDDILDLLDLADFRLGSSELTAFFRKDGHKHYRDCKDQVLRNFLQGLKLKHRPAKAPEAQA